MQYYDLPEEFLVLRLDGFNDGVQAAVKAILSVASHAKEGCECEIFSRQDVGRFLEKVAFEIDKEVVTRPGDKHIDPGLPEHVKAKLRRAIDKDSKFRRHILPEKKGKPWKETLGFAGGDTPSEDQIKKAFRDRAKQLHPDSQGVDSNEDFVELTEAKDRAMEELHGPKKKVEAPDEQPPKPPEKPACPKCGKASDFGL